MRNSNILGALFRGIFYIKLTSARLHNFEAVVRTMKASGSTARLVQTIRIQAAQLLREDVMETTQITSENVACVEHGAMVDPMALRQSRPLSEGV